MSVKKNRKAHRIPAEKRMSEPLRANWLKRYAEKRLARLKKPHAICCEASP